APSPLAIALARRLGDRGIASDVFWGNEGFCVDVALHHPTRAEDVTVGLLCDRARYDKAEDAVEWDLFRSEVFERQGWEVVRAWAPQVFRDPGGTVDLIPRGADAVVAKESGAHAAPVERDRAEAPN